MNINRSNYEEYFLLYADNELSQAEKNEVEIFVGQNVDLEEEFSMIKSTINIPDKNVSMADKSFLMKNDFLPFITDANCEEIFVLYHNNEISNEQKLKTEEFVKLYPKFKTEFELIEKAKLTSDEAVIFPDKKQLYRKEKTGRVIPLILWRSIAAAVFIGFGLWGSISYFSQKEGIRAVAFEQNNIKFPVANEPKVNSANPVDSEIEILPAATKKEIVANENEQKELKGNGRKIMTDENKNAVVKNSDKKKNLPEERSIPIEKGGREILAAYNPIKENANQVIAAISLPKNNVTEHIDKMVATAEPVKYAQNASYAIDNNSSDENYVFYNVKADEFNKSKVGGFLKKMKRIVERSNPIARLLSGEERQIASK